MSLEVALRADGGRTIGQGHLIRMLALAEMLRDDFKITYYTRSIDTIEKIGVPRGINLVRLDEKEHFNEFLEMLRGSEIVVLDNYFFDYNYQKSVKNLGCQLVCIDDTINNRYAADLVVNHSPYLDVTKYQTEPYTEILYGLAYSLIRPAFLESDRSSESNEGYFFVCFGGSDNHEFLSRIIREILRLGIDKKLEVVVGNDFPDDRLSSSDQLNINKNLSEDQMINLIENCEVAIVPSSTILYEVVALNRPVISGYTVENQMNIFKGFRQLEAIYPFGDFNDLESFGLYLEQILSGSHEQILKNQKKAFSTKPREGFLRAFKGLLES